MITCFGGMMKVHGYVHGAIHAVGWGEGRRVYTISYSVKKPGNSH